MPGSPAAQRPEQALAPQPPPEVRRAAAAISTLLDGERTDLRDVVLDMAGLDGFRRRVYELARRIKPGRTTTYGEIARAPRQPRRRPRGRLRARPATPSRSSFRAIASLAATGELHGFSAPGVHRNEATMLEIEAAPGFASSPCSPEGLPQMIAPGGIRACDIHHPVAADRHVLGEQTRPLLVALRPRAVAAHHTPPR